jgi:hypothetical protein
MGVMIQVPQRIIQDHVGEVWHIGALLLVAAGMTAAVSQRTSHLPPGLSLVVAGAGRACSSLSFLVSKWVGSNTSLSSTFSGNDLLNDLLL